MVVLHTNHGDIKLALDAERAPATVANFLQYVRDGHFDNGFEPGMRQKPTRAPIKNEADNGLPNARYSIAMARTSDPDSASAQFFINVADNAFLNHKAPNAQGWGYCVFGKVAAGFDIVDSIKGVRTGSRGGHQDVPAEDVVITKAEEVAE